MKRSLRALCLVVTLLFCANIAMAAGQATLQIKGSDTLINLVQKLAEVYEKFRSRDHALFKIPEIQNKLVELSFNQKVQNITGMQIADIFDVLQGRLLPSTAHPPF